jgi:hypothetical protein
LATRDAQAVARKSNKVLILFSGDYQRRDGIAAYLARLGLEAVTVDNDSRVGNAHHDILDEHNAKTSGSAMLFTRSHSSVSRMANHKYFSAHSEPVSDPLFM